MEDLYSFILAVTDHWVALMGGLISLIWTIYEKIQKRSVSIVVFSIITFACLSSAFFMAWRDEHHALEVAKNELSKLTSGFKGEFLTIIASHGDSTTTIFALITVSNLGRTSIVNRLTMDIPGLNLIDIRPVRIHDGHIIKKPASKVTITKDVMFSEKDSTPIPEGGESRGWIAFTITGIPSHSIDRHISTLRVNFMDIRDIKYSIAFNPSAMSGPNDGDRYYPRSGQD